MGANPDAIAAAHARQMDHEELPESMHATEPETQLGTQRDMRKAANQWRHGERPPAPSEQRVEQQPPPPPEEQQKPQDQWDLGPNPLLQLGKSIEQGDAKDPEYAAAQQRMAANPLAPYSWLKMIQSQPGHAWQEAGRMSQALNAFVDPAGQQPGMYELLNNQNVTQRIFTDLIGPGVVVEALRALQITPAGRVLAYQVIPNLLAMTVKYGPVTALTGGLAAPETAIAEVTPEIAAVTGEAPAAASVISGGTGLLQRMAVNQASQFIAAGVIDRVNPIEMMSMILQSWPQLAQEGLFGDWMSEEHYSKLFEHAMGAMALTGMATDLGGGLGGKMNIKMATKFNKLHEDMSANHDEAVKLSHERVDLTNPKRVEDGVDPLHGAAMVPPVAPLSEIWPKSAAVASFDKFYAQKLALDDLGVSPHEHAIAQAHVDHGQGQLDMAADQHVVEDPAALVATKAPPEALPHTAQEMVDAVAAKADEIQQAQDPRLEVTKFNPSENYHAMSPAQQERYGYYKDEIAKVEEALGHTLEEHHRLLRPSEEYGQYLSDDANRAWFANIGHLEEITGHPLPLSFVQPDNLAIEGGIRGLMDDSFAKSDNPGHARQTRVHATAVAQTLWSGLVNTLEDPVGSAFRYLAGSNRVIEHEITNGLTRSLTRDVGDHFRANTRLTRRSTAKFIEHWKSMGTEIARAKTGSEEALGQLPDIAHAHLAMMDRLMNLVRKQSVDLGDDRQMLTNYLPLIRELDPKRAKPVKAVAGLLRDIGLTEGERATTMFQRARMDYGVRVRINNPFEGNEAVAKSQAWLEKFIDTGVTSSFPDQAKEVLQQHGYTPDEIGKLEEGLIQASKDPKRAALMKDNAKEIAAQVFPRFAENAYEIFPRWIRAETKRILTLQQLHFFTGAIDKEGKPLAVDLRQLQGSAEEQKAHVDALLKTGKYKIMDGAESHAISTELHDLITEGQRLQEVTPEHLLGKNFGRYYRLQGKVKGAIVYFNPIHRRNIASRQIAFAMQNPKEAGRILATAAPDAIPWTLDKIGHLRRELTGKGGMNHPDFYSNFQRDWESYQTKLRHWSAGMHTPTPPRGGWLSMAFGLQGEMMQDPQGYEMPGMTHMPSAPSGFSPRHPIESTPLRYGAKMVRGFHDHSQRALWHMVDEFGHTVTDITYNKLVGDGWDPARAMLYATDIGNGWMGHIRPETWNPTAHAIAGTALFAPNWQRSFLQLSTPLFRDHLGLRTGDAQLSEQYMHQMWRDEVKTLSSFYLQDYLTRNALNYFLSGHGTTDNQDGNKHNLEISQPWAINALKAAHQADVPVVSGVVDSFLPRKFNPDTGAFEVDFGGDPSTNSVMSAKNPLRNQQMDWLEKVMGDTGAKGWADPREDWNAPVNAAMDIAGPLNPLMFMGGLLNIDMYQSARNKTWRNVDPNGISALSMASALTPLVTPLDVAGGSRATTRATEFFTSQGQRKNESFMQFLGDVKDQGLAQLLQQLTSVVPAFDFHAKTKGVALSSDDYKKVGVVEDNHAKNMMDAELQRQSGQMSYKDWIDFYHQESTTYHAGLASMYNAAGSPEGGYLSAIAKEEKLYDQAKDSHGQINWEVFDQLDSALKSTLDQQTLNYMQEYRRKEELKYPTLKLYHRTFDKYIQLQNDFASAPQIGKTPQQFRKELAEYGKLYGLTTDQTAYKTDHPEIAVWEKLKKAWELKTPEGWAYALFYDAPTLLSLLHTRENLKKMEDATTQALSQ